MTPFLAGLTIGILIVLLLGTFLIAYEDRERRK
jgi:hypothetical protein